MKKTFADYFKKIYSKEHIYPPVEIFEDVDDTIVLEKWKSFLSNSNKKIIKPKLGIYIHIPFCMSRCKFCYCYSIVTDSEGQIDNYLDCLIYELKKYSSVLKDYPISSLYIGGGTPSVLSIAQLQKLFYSIKSNFNLSEKTHINFEATPLTADKEKLIFLGKQGVTRITFGIQTNENALLKKYNREQKFEDVKEAVKNAKDAGIKYVNLDLIVGLPEDTINAFLKNLKDLCSLKPDMIHIYPFSETGSYKPNPRKREMGLLGSKFLEKENYKPIKNDGFGLDEKSRNMQVIEKIEDAASILGIGSTSRSHIFNLLSYCTCDYEQYLKSFSDKSIKPYKGKEIDENIQIQKYFMDNLKQGLDIGKFNQLFNKDPNRILNTNFKTVSRIIEVKDNQIFAKKEFKKGQKINPYFYETKYLGKIYLKFLEQRNIKFKRKKNFKPDINFYRFLALRLTKSNVYPPTELSKKLSHGEIRHAWKNLISTIKKENKKHKFGIYVHFPFCIEKCNFCYCHSNKLENQKEILDYTKAMVSHIESLKDLFKEVEFNSVYFGGGTPSILSSKLLEAFFKKLFSSFKFTRDSQFNFEGTPFTLNPEKLKILKKYGINRITLGVQALDPEITRKINRIQTPNLVREVVKNIRSLGFENLNIDLVAGLPGQTFNSFKKDLTEVISWRPEMVHVYPFSNTPNTLYYQDGGRLTKEEAKIRNKMLRYAQNELRKKGYKYIKNDSFGLRDSAKNVQEVEKIEDCSSVLPLGYLARGHIFSQATYANTSALYKELVKNGKPGLYSGFLITKQNDIEKYILSNLRGEIPRIKFYNLFDEDILEHYYEQFKFLEQKGLVRITPLCIESKIENSIDHLTYAKLFFSDKFIEELKRYFKDDYNPEKDYLKELKICVDQNF